MKCKDVYLHICDNLDANLNSAKCRAIKRHVKACPDCTAFLESVRKTVKLYRSAPSPDVPSTAHRRLFKSINLTWNLPEKPRRRRAAQ
jgi:hypothetical protein